MPGYHPKHVREGYKHKHVPNPRKGEFTGKNKQNLSSHDEIAIPSKEDHNAPAKFKPLHFKKKWSSEKKALHEKEVHATHKLGAKHSNIAANIGKAAKSVKDEVVKAKEDLVEGFKAEQYKPQQFKKIEKFFETMPKLTHTVKVMNPNTKKENEVVLEGLQNFFG